MKIRKIKTDWEICEFREAWEVNTARLPCTFGEIRQAVRLANLDIQPREHGDKKSVRVFTKKPLKRGAFLVKVGRDYEPFEQNVHKRIDAILAQNIRHTSDVQVYINGVFADFMLARANNIPPIKSKDLFVGDILTNYNTLVNMGEKVPPQWETFSLLSVAHKKLPAPDNTYYSLLEAAGFGLNNCYASVREMFWMWRLQNRDVKFVDTSGEKKKLFEVA
jgi:hypothetical protein